MMNFTDEQYNKIYEEGKQIMAGISEGKTTRDILAQIYVDNLEDKTIKQGYIISDAIIRNVKNFDCDYSEIQKDLDLFLKKFQDNIDEGKTCAERCNYWLKLGLAVSGAAVVMGDDSKNIDDIIKEIESQKIDENEANADIENELRKQAIEAIKNSGAMLGGLIDQAEALKEIASADEAANLIVNLGNEEIELRAIVSMLTYTKIKSGEIDNMPMDITAEQITTIVCAGFEQMKIADAVSKGNMAVDIAYMLLAFLGIVVISMFAVMLGYLAILLASDIISVIAPILIIPAILVVVTGISHIVTECSARWEKDSRVIVEKTALVIGSVAKGIANIASYVRSNVIFGIVSTASNIFNKITHFKEENEITNETAMETQIA